MYSLTYLKPSSLAEASALLAEHPEAKLLAGGMTLIPSLKQRLAQPSHLIDIAHLRELQGVEVNGDRLVVGAGTRHADVARSTVIEGVIPALVHLARQLGDPQVRNQGTMGGSVANNDPASDYPAAVLALDARIHTTRREIAADDFFLGMFATALEEGEIITRFEFPIPKRAAYSKFPHPASGYAMTGVFVADFGGKEGVPLPSAKGIRVAVTGAGSGVFRWTGAEAALSKRFEPGALANLVVSAEDLNSDLHAPAEYRANLVKVMGMRAVEQLV